MVPQPSTSEITRLLTEWTSGRRESAPELWALVYRELRQIASAYVRNARRSIEMFGRVIDSDGHSSRGGGKGHFNHPDDVFTWLAAVCDRCRADAGRSHGRRSSTTRARPAYTTTHRSRRTSCPREFRLRPARLST